MLVSLACEFATERESQKADSDPGTPPSTGPAGLKSGRPHPAKSMLHIPTSGIEPGCQTLNCCPTGLPLIAGDDNANH
jgi:hypothetical protein